MRRLDATRVRVSSLAALRAVRMAITLVLIGLLSAISLAATRSWDGDGGADTNWTTDANWSSNIEPVAGDTAAFDRGAAFNYVVTFPILLPFGSDETTDRLIVGSNTVTFQNDHSNTNYLVTNPSTAETGRALLIGDQANDTQAVLVSHLSVLSAPAATIGHLPGANGTLKLEQNNDAFNVTGVGLVPTLIIGREGTGLLDVRGGADVNLSTGDVVLGRYGNSNGTVNISGSGSTFQGSDELVVGYAGNGTLNVTGGGTVSTYIAILGYASGSMGHASISGAGSIWNSALSAGIVVGGMGDATLQITDGGRVNTGFGRLGTASDSSGEVTVSGASSLWTLGANLHIGEGGNGKLQINGGATVSSNNDTFSRIGMYGGTGEVSVSSGGIWQNNLLSVGENGDGTLNIFSAGQVFASTSYIGLGSTSEGSVSVTGAGSTWTTSGQLNVGVPGPGSLSISDGGLVASNATFIARSILGGSVTVDGAGSKLRTTTDVNVGESGPGLLSVANGGAVEAANILVKSSGELRGNGVIYASVQNSGLVSPGASPGALTIQEDYNQASNGELLIELATSSYDQLLVTGDATLAGTVTISLLGGFVPSLGQSFTFLTSDDVDGTFASEVFPSVPNLGFDVVYNAQSVVLSVVSALPGDYNGNGVVDAADYVVWRKDSNRTQAQYDVWRAHFGQPPGSGSVASENASIPEPTTLVLLMIAAAGWRLRLGRAA